MASSSGAKQTLMVRSGDVATNYVLYPPTSVRYEDVVINPRLFMEALEKFHSTLGTKFMIPIIGGKDLDLHRLFIEVTSRGGFEKIMRERRWKEVTAVFNFPSTATNASFVLRKYYMSLLHHFEQIYFFKARGWIPSNDSFQSVSYPPGVPQRMTEEQPRRVKFSPEATSETPPGSQVNGVIDGKFEGGYLISVTIGSEKLKGVLYMSSSQIAPRHRSTSQIPGGKNESATSPVLRRRRRKKCEMKKRDPSHPKPNRSGYNFFFAEQHARLKPLYAGKDREISRMIGELWTNMKEPDRVVYQDKAAKDKERYIIEMENYREMLKTGKIISNAMPIRQLPLDIDPNIPNEGIDDIGEGSPQTPEYEMSSKSSIMSDSENKITENDSELYMSPGVEYGPENLPKEEELKKIENENRNESLEVKNAPYEKNDIEMHRGESEKRHEAENKNLENENLEIMLDETESAEIVEEKSEDNGERKKRPMPGEERELTASDKRQKAEDEI